MSDLYLPLFTDTFLASVYDADLRSFRESGEDARLLERLRHWAAKDFQKETTAETDFVDVFFKQTWDHWGSGTRAKAEGYTLYPKLAVGSAGQGGGTGLMDLGLGWFGRDGLAQTPQVVCEFKDVRSGLDKPQRRKGSDRSPVRQCADYLKEASQKLYGNEPIQPTWGLVSDMNEIRLYWRRTMPSQYQRFFIKAPEAKPGERVIALLDDGDDAALQRFLFAKLLHRDMVLTTHGASPLEELLLRQGAHERKIETTFYAEYQQVRETIYRALVDANPTFKAARGKLVRFAQRFLDRSIFILFCEDMGAALNFPPHVLEDLLKRKSLDPYYDPNDTSVWHEVKRLFVSMRDGTPFGETRINRFNGGLFAEEPELEALAIPNRVFCTKGQGADEASIHASPRTLLFLSATYYFGTHGTARERGIGLYTLGRIFEQSITDLEFMEAKADDRPSLTELSKRKRDGVYYTPEWVTYFLVEETVGTHLREMRRRLDLDDGRSFSEKDLAHHQEYVARRGKKSDRRKANPSVVTYLAKLDQYAAELEGLKVVDPACGSGAFLIQALDLLVRERRWVAEEREAITVTTGLTDIDKLTKGVLSQNLYGVDINPESVEITRLALWLHSALPDRPLCSLDENIRCGNSLVGTDFYAQRGGGLFSDEKRERINAFDWKVAFPDVFARPDGRSGFDCVVGNPPYVKLQNFRQVDPDVAEYLVQACRIDGTPLYASTQTGNFDLYLPFLERGMELLNEGGRMGFIAPNVWLLNEYGAGLRGKLAKKRERRLERWVDFKDFQVFDEAITYTALQFFRGRPGHAVACLFAPDGKLAGAEWTNADAIVPYAELGRDSDWLFLPDGERTLMRRLDATCERLGDPELTEGISQGMISGAFPVYGNVRVSPGRYRHRRTIGDKTSIEEIELEDACVVPLAGGADVARYVAPRTDLTLIFPYRKAAGEIELRPAGELASEFPRTWAHLKRYEPALRGRDGGKLDDDAWYRFSRNQNLDHRERPKILVAGTAPTVRAVADDRGELATNDKRVYSVLPRRIADLWYLLAVLNGPVISLCFRRRARPKAGGYYDIESQYLERLPVPPATDQQRAEVAGLAKELQRLHTARRDATLDIDRRLTSAQTQGDERAPAWLWADVGDVATWRAKAPVGTARERTAWAKAEQGRVLGTHFERVEKSLHAGARFEVVQKAGALGLLADGAAVIADVFVDAADAPFLAAQWRHKLRRTTVTATFDAKRLVALLLDLRRTDNAALRTQVVELDARVGALDAEIITAEAQMNERLYELYALTPEERALVEEDARRVRGQ